jgi:tRNA1Val (adenine37-N6)-methyltransferase
MSSSDGISFARSPRAFNEQKKADTVLAVTPTSANKHLSPPASPTTSDRLFDGALALTQPARGVGYRANVDAILLAAFAGRLLPGTERPSPRRARHAVDLGSGVGAVALSLLHLGAAEHVTLIEIDPMLAELAAKNLSENGWNERGYVQCTSVSFVTSTLREPADLVVCNPPYVAPNRGRPPQDHVAQAKVGDLDTFIRAARETVGRRARACFVYPAIEGTTLLGTLRAHGLEPKRLRPVHGSPHTAARVLLVEAAPGKHGGLVVEPPLLETNHQGGASESLAALLRAPRQGADRAQSRRPLERSGDSTHLDRESAR